ncbi:MAG: LuxR C-terminal-related transcriptional regulator [Pseudomonadota bacterium]
MSGPVSIQRQLSSLSGVLPQLMGELFEHIQLGVVVARQDGDQAAFWANPHCSSMLGEGPLGLLTRSFANGTPRVHPEDRGAPEARVQVLRQGRGATRPTLIRLASDDGHWIWVEVTTHVLEAGEAPLVLWVLQDVSERRRVEEELRAEQEELRAQQEALELRSRELGEQNRELIELVQEVSLERERQRQRVEANARLLLLPQLERVRDRAPADLQPDLDALAASVRGLGSELGITLRQARPALTDRELEICGLIRAGLRTAVIARTLGLSRRSVDAHRHNIRTKLGLRGRSVNLASHLASLDRRNP